MDRPKLSVVIPIYNEEKSIHELYRRLSYVLHTLCQHYELIFVNDGSQDASSAMLMALAQQDLKVKYITLSRNFGHQVAVTAGLNHAKGDRVVIIDGDLQDPPETIKDLYNKSLEGYEVVFAKRKHRPGESLFKLWTAKLFYRILTRITSIHVPVDTGDFRIIDHKVLNVLKQMPEQNKFLRGQISWIGFRQTYIEYDREVRKGGKSGYTLRKMFKFALDGITSFSDFPLKLASVSGFMVSGVAFILMIYTLYAKLMLKDTVPGWASLMVSILFLGGIQLISIGIIGEYISRIGADVRKRPLYIIDQSNIQHKTSS
ncbi:glycosyltransferase family 2 protein [Rapidithrix thailandica]|uniref:Glycosyltransferase family 2 protein n=1 Tax=Rapidithrix thailandica TaxID=413964 RepID=A0AAW9S2W2_9BACT